MTAEQEEAVVSAIRSLRPLRHRVRDVMAFKAEVKEIITSIFAKHKTGTKAIQQVLRSRIEVGPILEKDVNLWLTLIKRRLLSRSRSKNPFTFMFKCDMTKVVFDCIKFTVKKQLLGLAFR